MWENAAPGTPEILNHTKKRKHTDAAESNLIVRGQVLLCFLFLAIVMAARTLAWPFFPALRIAFDQAMQPEQELFLSEERNLSKFTEQASETFSTVWQQVCSQWNALGAENGSSRTAHAKAETVPSNARAESYLPNFTLTFPLAGQFSSKTSGYGWRTNPLGGTGSDFHLGNDLAAAEGTPVLAAADGVVRYAATHTSYGNYVRILHEDGDETLYAHLQYLFVHAGQEVRAGDVLGTVGETGNTTGPHLHFELLHGGIRYDPSEALQRAA